MWNLRTIKCEKNVVLFSDVLVLEEVEKELNAEGTDPHTFFVAFRLEISDD